MRPLKKKGSWRDSSALGVLCAPLKDLGVVSSTHKVAHYHILFWFPWVPGMHMVGAQTYIQATHHTDKIQINFKLINSVFKGWEMELCSRVLP